MDCKTPIRLYQFLHWLQTERNVTLTKNAEDIITDFCRSTDSVLPGIPITPAGTDAAEKYRQELKRYFSYEGFGDVERTRKRGSLFTYHRRNSIHRVGIMTYVGGIKSGASWVNFSIDNPGKTPRDLYINWAVLVAVPFKKTYLLRMSDLFKNHMSPARKGITIRRGTPDDNLLKYRLPELKQDLGLVLPT